MPGTAHHGDDLIYRPTANANRAKTDKAGGRTLGNLPGCIRYKLILREEATDVLPPYGIHWGMALRNKNVKNISTITEEGISKWYRDTQRQREQEMKQLQQSQPQRSHWKYGPREADRPGTVNSEKWYTHRENTTMREKDAERATRMAESGAQQYFPHRRNRCITRHPSFREKS